MKIWLTLPYDDEGVIQAEAKNLNNGYWECVPFGNLAYARCFNFLKMENIWWHRRKKNARVRAIEYRNRRLAEASAEITRLSSLPPL